jgi:hypothetical protein
VVGRFAAPPAGLQSPTLWGSEPHIVAMFGPYAADLRCVRRHFNFRYRSAAHWIEVFRKFYGPVHKVYGALDVAEQSQLTDAIAELLARRNIAGPGSLIVPGEYLELVITKG